MSKTKNKRRKGESKTQSIFTRPTPLSEPLCSFLNVEAGTELPRTDVTSRINVYVKEHNLQNPENKKQILADDKLKSLLYLTDNDQLTYFNLQKFLKYHFLKKNNETGEVLPFAPPVSS